MKKSYEEWKKAVAHKESTNNPTKVNASGHLGLYQLGARLFYALKP